MLKKIKLNTANKITISFILLFSLSCLKLCANPSSMTPEQAKIAREKFITEAKTHIGKPYLYASVGPDSFDCSGFVYYVAKTSIKLQIPRSSSGIYKTAQKIEDKDLEPGDLLFFGPKKSTVNHVGIYLGGDKFISAVSDGPRTGIMISSTKEDYWKKTYICAGRIIASAKDAIDIKKNSDLQIETVTVDDSNKVSRTKITTKNDNKKSKEKNTAPKNPEVDTNLQNDELVKVTKPQKTKAEQNSEDCGEALDCFCTFVECFGFL